MKTQKAYQVTCRCMIGNLVLSALKIMAGIFGTSSAMIADGLHSLSDLVTDVIVLFGIHFSAMPADKEHPYGHGRIDTFASLIMSVILILVAFGIVFEAAKSIYGVLQGNNLSSPGIIALVMALVSIIIKEVMYRYTAVVGQRINSMAMITNAWHHRSDAFSSVAVLIGISGAYFLGERWSVLDPAVAILVGLLIIGMGLKMTKGAFDEMVDTSLPQQTVDKIKEICLLVDDIKNPHNIKTRRLGRDVAISLHVNLPAKMTLMAVHTRMKKIEQSIQEEFGRNTSIVVHPDPIGSDAADD